MIVYEVRQQTEDYDSWTVIMFTTKKAAYKWIMKAYYKEWESGHTDNSPYWPYYWIQEREVFEE